METTWNYDGKSTLARNKNMWQNIDKNWVNVIGAHKSSRSREVKDPSIDVHINGCSTHVSLGAGTPDELWGCGPMRQGGEINSFHAPNFSILHFLWEWKPPQNIRATLRNASVTAPRPANTSQKSRSLVVHIMHSYFKNTRLTSKRHIVSIFIRSCLVIVFHSRIQVFANAWRKQKQIYECHRKRQLHAWVWCSSCRGDIRGSSTEETSIGASPTHPWPAATIWRAYHESSISGKKSAACENVVKSDFMKFLQTGNISYSICMTSPHLTDWYTVCSLQVCITPHDVSFSDKPIHKVCNVHGNLFWNGHEMDSFFHRRSDPWRHRLEPMLGPLPYPICPTFGIELAWKRTRIFS